VEVAKALLHQELRRAVVEVRVKLVDHALKADDGEEARDERCVEREGRDVKKT
jgi:hypothetical protein